MRTEKGSCHCKAVRFEVDLENGFENIRRCNCSMCSRKGAIMAGVPLERLRVTHGADKLSLYQWNTKTAKHYFCSVCGIYTHHQRRSVPTEYGFNLACIEGVDLSAIGPIGASNGAAQSLVEAGS
ncbi:GFA family protein [Arenimonas soli]|nr:GFA family protein [Arenimonas soli]